MNGENQQGTNGGVNTDIFGTSATTAVAPALVAAPVSGVAAQSGPAVATSAPAPAVSAAVEPAAEEGAYKPLRPMNFELRHPYTGGEIEYNPDLPTVPYPSASRKATTDSLKRAPHINITGKKVDALAMTIRDSLGQIALGNDQDDLRGREGSDFRQEVEINGQKLFGFAPRFTPKAGVKYVGEAARNLVRTQVGLGTVFQAPLWHSGFWITLRTPSEGDLIELHRALAQEKITLGRSTYGILFSQVTGYTTKVMLDFIEAHIHSHSLILPDDGSKSVTEYIKAADYQILVWALTCATWPSGYQIQRACMTDPEKCNYVLTERVNVARLLWVDASSLTERQRAHMLSRQKHSMKPEQVELYCSEFLRGRQAKVKLSDTVSMVLKMPSILEYIAASYEWIGKLEEQQTRVMNMREDERNDYLMQHAQAQSMRQYSHFVHSLLVGAGDEPDEIDDPETIPSILADLSSEDELRNAFMDRVQEYQNTSLIAFVGLPNYKCPSCGGMQLPTAVPGQQNELIALDVTQTFFTLLMQKLASIQAR